MDVSKTFLCQEKVAYLAKLRRIVGFAFILGGRLLVGMVEEYEPVIRLLNLNCSCPPTYAQVGIVVTCLCYGSHLGYQKSHRQVKLLR
jgi:hypothetical protein